MSKVSFREQTRLPTYRAQRMLGPVVIVLGLIIAITGLFDPDFQPGRISAALNAGLVPILMGLFTWAAGYSGERTVELKRRIAELEAEKRE